MTLNFNPFPLLESPRLNLRSLADSDVNEVFALRSNPETMKFIPRPLAITPEDALEHIKVVQETISKNEGINWALTLKENDVLIGIAGFYRIQPQNFRCEIGYMLSPDFHNQGYITETIRTLLDFAFNQLHFHSIEAVIDPANVASEKVLQKNGFKKEAHFVENFYWQGEFLDTVIYSLLKKDFS